MEKRAREFLTLSGELYEDNKRKWKKMVDNFNEDVYNDTIIKVYDKIMSGEDTDGDLLAYWFKSFKNNLKRENKYSGNKTKNELDAIKDKEDIEDTFNIDYSDISDILLDVRCRFNRKTFEVFRMYLLCNITIDQISKITRCDGKKKIKRVREWINDNKDIN